MRDKNRNDVTGMTVKRNDENWINSSIQRKTCQVEISMINITVFSTHMALNRG